MLKRFSFTIIFLCFLFMFSSITCLKTKTNSETFLKMETKTRKEGCSINLKKMSDNRVAAVSFVGEVQSYLGDYHSCMLLYKK